MTKYTNNCNLKEKIIMTTREALSSKERTDWSLVGRLGFKNE